MSDDDHKSIAEYLVDLIADGLDNEYVKVVRDAEGSPVFFTERPGLHVFRVVCDREGEECYVEVAVGPPGNFRRGDKVISRGADPVGKVLQVNEERGVLVQWPPSAGEYVRPCWEESHKLRPAP